MIDIFELSQKKVVICAEIGINHQGQLSIAEELIDAAADCKVDAVKFQAFKSHALYAGEPAIPPSLEIKDDWWPILRKRARDRGLYFGVSIFDEPSLKAINESSIELDFVKIASGEIDDFPLIKKQLDLSNIFVISTGGARFSEIHEMTDFLNKHRKNTILLECTPLYPSPPLGINLLNIDFFIKIFNYPTGFSDHTKGIHFAIAAVARGARFIEKHFTLNHDLAGIDHSHSADLGEMRALVKAIAEIDQGMKTDTKQIEDQDIEKAAREGRKSIAALIDIKANEMILPSYITGKRPGFGIPMRRLGSIYGRKVRENIKAGTVITWGMVE